MYRRSLIAALLLLTGAAASASAQAYSRAVPRRIDREARADTAEAPTVEVSLEGTRTYAFGAPVRVSFRVSEDAYVVVARVDAEGHLTLLSPASRTMGTAVPGGRDIQVRGRRGAASFYATDRIGGGFIFALASFDPFDLSRLGLRDFDRFVTGTYVGRPSRVYIGDPHRVVTRFASMISFSDESLFDYAVDYYNVDAPYYLTSTGYSSYCDGSYGFGRRSLAERWDDEYYSVLRGNSGYNCRAVAQCGQLADNPLTYSLDNVMFGFINPVCLLGRGPTTNGGRPPTTPPGSDSLRVPGWLADSIRSGRPDTVGVIPDQRASELREGLGRLRRGATGTEGPRGPIVIADDDPSGRSYAIPGRALRNSRSTIGERRDRGEAYSPTRPDRTEPAATDGSEITWVRPPREVVEGGRNPNGEEFLPRSPRQPRGDRDAGPSRGDGRPTYVNPTDDRGPSRSEPTRAEPPSRGLGPRFDAPPPNVRTNADAPRYEPPPRHESPRFDTSRPQSESTDQRPSVRSEPVRAEPVRADPPRPASTEKKPDKPDKPDKQP